MQTRLLVLLVLVGGLLLAAACGGGDDETPTATATSPAPTATSPAATATATTPAGGVTPTATSTLPTNGDVVILEIATEGEVLRFDKDFLTASAGDQVLLRYTNNASLQPHQWVLVENGTKDAVATAGLIAGPANDYVPPGDDRVIASMKLVDPGTIGELRFTAPAAGIYQFVCTFPGHSVTKFGTFEVTP